MPSLTWKEDVQRLLYSLNEREPDFRSARQKLDELPQILSDFKQLIHHARLATATASLPSLEQGFGILENFCQVVEDSRTYRACTAHSSSFQLVLEKCIECKLDLTQSLNGTPPTGEEMKSLQRRCMDLLSEGGQVEQDIEMSGLLSEVRESMEIFRFDLDHFKEIYGGDRDGIDRTIQNYAQHPDEFPHFVYDLETWASDIYHAISYSDELEYMCASLGFMVPALSSP